MIRRSLVWLVALAVAAALAAPAFAVRVHVRVEGLNRTLFGATEPLLEPFTGTLVAADGSRHALRKPTALGALEAASRRGELYYRLRSLSFGLFVDRVGRYPSGGASGWVFKVNGVSPPVGAADYLLEDGDIVLWYFARFGPSGGPKTLDLLRPPDGGGCVVTRAVDDTGASDTVRDVVFKIDGRAVRDADGSFCPRGHWHRLRATKTGYVRSRVLSAR